MPSVRRLQRRLHLLGDHLVSDAMGDARKRASCLLVVRLALLQRDDSAAPRNRRQHTRRQRPPSAALDHGDSASSITASLIHHKLIVISTPCASADSRLTPTRQNRELSRRTNAEARNIHIAIQMRRYINMRPALMPFVYIGDEPAPMVAP